MLSKKFLYKDLNNDLFKILSKNDHKYYIQDINNGTKFYKRSVGKNTRDFSHGMNCQYMIVI